MDSVGCGQYVPSIRLASPASVSPPSSSRGWELQGIPCYLFRQIAYMKVITREAEKPFKQGMPEIDDFLQVSPEECLPGFPVSTCEQDSNEN